jgi:hypothetical protein
LNHSFNIEVAAEFGVPEAIMIENMFFWIEKNRASDKHFYNNKHWTYNSVKAFEILFPYWTPKQIRGVLERLEASGAIEVGNYNKVAYDRTKWYALADKVYEFYRDSKNHLPKRANRIAEKGEPIPDINTDINTDTNNNDQSTSDMVESIYKSYPRKEGKSEAIKRIPKLIKEHGMEQIQRCIDRYKDKLKSEGTPKKYTLQAGTFFGGKYMDYLDENYEGEMQQQRGDARKAARF